MRRTTQRNWTFLLMVLFLLAGGGGLSLIVPLDATAASAALLENEEAEETEDILHMRDGRVLHGEILEERRNAIVFRRVDRNLNLESTITIFKQDILEIERDVPLETARDSDRDAGPSPQRPAEPRQQRQPRGLAEGDPSDTDLPALLVIPMKGQMGTDIHPYIYRQIIDDIRKLDPDVIIWRMKCGVQEDLFASLVDLVLETHEDEEGLFDLTEEYRELVRLLQDRLSDYEQVMWVEDSYGVSSLVALAWDRMFMAPDGRLGGLRTLYDRVAGFPDDDVRAKMLGYWIGMANGFMLRGNRDTAVADAMIRPDRRLSATWRGREVTWHLDTSGEYVVLNSDERVASFDTQIAENLLLSEGTAETVDDLALLLGYREYRLLHGAPQERIESYVTDWRRVFANAERRWQDYQQNREWGELHRARQDLRAIIRYLRRYRAVEIRFQMTYGANLDILEILEEQLTDEIRGGGGGGGGLGAGGGRGGG